MTLWWVLYIFAAYTALLGWSVSKIDPVLKDAEADRRHAAEQERLAQQEEDRRLMEAYRAKHRVTSDLANDFVRIAQGL